MNASLALVPVPVCGDVLYAGRDERGVVQVSVRAVCRVLGIAPNMQIERLKRKPWAGGIVTISPEGQDTFVIPLRALPMWLATVQASRVREEARPTLERFQCEAADVLAAYFLGGAALPVVSADDTPEQVRELRARLDVLEARVAEGERERVELRKALGAPVKGQLALFNAPARAEVEAAFRERVRVAAEGLASVRMVSLLDALGVSPKVPSGKLQRRIGAALRALGYTNAERPRFQGPRARVWIRREVLQ